MQERGLTPESLAEVVDIKASTVNQILRGAISNPRIYDFLPIMKILNLDINELLQIMKEDKINFRLKV